MNIELDKDSLQRQSEMCKQIADTVRDTFNLIQEALGSPLRISKPENSGDDYTKETFPYDEDTLNNDDMLEEEEEEENEDDEKLADQEHKWEADNDR